MASLVRQLDRCGIQVGAQRVDLVAGDGRPLPGRHGDAPVDVEAEQLAQRGLAIGGVGVEEVGEAALRQHDRAVELVDVEAEEPGDLGRDGLGVAGEPGLAVLEDGVLRRGSPLPCAERPAPTVYVSSPSSNSSRTRARVLTWLITGATALRSS